VSYGLRFGVAETEDGRRSLRGKIIDFNAEFHRSLAHALSVGLVLAKNARSRFVMYILRATNCF
jgi:hypothetical protein